MLSFHLNDDFVADYATRPVPWGFQDAAGNSLGEITFLRTYSRLKPDGTKERWHEVCRRVIEGMFTIQYRWSSQHRLPWNHNKAQRAAQDAFDRLFNFKWTPPGRGLWMMGTPLVMDQHNSAALQNCAFVSTADMTRQNPTEPFEFLMEASMLGVGVGFDDKGSTREFPVYTPRSDQAHTYVVPDSREGWVESVALLLKSYLLKDRGVVSFDYSLVRPAGEPIKTFGGTAAGPEPLRRLHEILRRILEARVEETPWCIEGPNQCGPDCRFECKPPTVTSREIADIGNLIGVCVVSGNVRRSAELLMGQLDNPDFLNLKNPEVFPERNAYPGGWGWMSNNSVEVSVGQDLDPVIPGIARNGEPGVIWMDTTRKYGRLADPPNNKDWRAAGYNPCAEQSLESYEMCTLVETYINRHESLEDFKKTLKVAYLYAKTVTLVPTHWPKTNAIMQRNRRIGTSISGIANFADNRGVSLLREWMDEGYKTVRHYDEVYSEWLCVRESIKVTTVKPSGTVSILAGESPGVHWSPGGEFFNRAIRFSKDDPIVTLYRIAGYRIEPASESPETTVVIFFPIHSSAKRSEKQVSIYEKAHLAAMAQAWWSDNSVSVTLSFDAEEEPQHVGTVLKMFDGQLKTASFLPMGNFTYPQMPYTEILPEEYQDARMTLFQVDLSPIYDGDLDAIDALGESFCSTDACEVKTITNEIGAQQ